MIVVVKRLELWIILLIIFNALSWVFVGQLYRQIGTLKQLNETTYSDLRKIRANLINLNDGTRVTKISHNNRITALEQKLSVLPRP